VLGIHHLKELRPGSAARSEIRVLFAFDPTRSAVSQIEHGEVSSFEVIARYVEALGGRLDLVADFGDQVQPIARHRHCHRSMTPTA
jgi:hypothetical protein